MSSPQRSSSTSENDSNIRKRVCKACDRCRLKKSKCDGASPCSRCRADNAICVFGERKKSHDKVYPKGYVEMLEQQQAQLVAGLRELYRRLNAGEDWPGTALADAANGQPLTHDILERLDLLHMQTENHGVTDGFEEDTDAMQRRLIESGAALVHSHRRQRAGSVSSNASDMEPGNAHSSAYESPAALSSSYDTPTSARSSQFSDSFRAPPTPPMNTATSPFGRPAGKHFSPALMQAGVAPTSNGIMRHQTWSPATSSAPAIVGTPDDPMEFMTYESPIGYHDPMMFSTFGGGGGIQAGPGGVHEWNDAVDMDFSNFIATAS